MGAKQSRTQEPLEYDTNIVLHWNNSIRQKDCDLRKKLGVDNNGIHEIYSRKCSVCKKEKNNDAFTSNQWKKNDSLRACKNCMCCYCHKKGKMTKEHLLPKSVGGNVIVKACGHCNKTRGNSGTFADFRIYINRRPDIWAKAVKSSQADTDILCAWLKEHNLLSTTIRALTRL